MPWWDYYKYHRFVHSPEFCTLLSELEEYTRLADERDRRAIFGEEVWLNLDEVSRVILSHPEVYRMFGYKNVPQHQEFYNKMIRKFYHDIIKPLKRVRVKWLPEKIIVDMWIRFLGKIRRARAIAGKYRKARKVPRKSEVVWSKEMEEKATEELLRKLEKFLSLIGE